MIQNRSETVHSDIFWSGSDQYIRGSRFSRVRFRYVFVYLLRFGSGFFGIGFGSAALILKLEGERHTKKILYMFLWYNGKKSYLGPAASV